MNAFEIATFDGQVTRLRCAGAEHDGVEVVHQLLRGNVLPDLRVAAKGDAFLFHELKPAQDDLLLVELHVRDAVHQQPAWAIRPFEDRYGVAGLVELRGGAKSRGTGPNAGERPAR